MKQKDYNNKDYNIEEEYISIEEAINNKKNGKNEKPKKKRKGLKIFLIIFGVMILCLGLFAYGYTQYLLNLIPDDVVTNPDGTTSRIDKKDIENFDGTTNVLLMGVDKRPNDDTGRTDAMMLVSIDGKTNQIKMISFMRDLYVSIAEDNGMNRLNAAFAFGGPELLIKTIKEDFEVDIDAYAWVDFPSFVKAIDVMGGIEIDLKQEEINLLNEHMPWINKDMDKAPSDSYVTESGVQTLNGRQALAYSRIRYTSGGDFERTQRQRTVMEKVLAKTKDSNIITLNSLALEILPLLNTNLSNGSITKLMLKSSEILNFDTSQYRVPADGLYYPDTVNGMDVIVPHMDENISSLRDFLNSKATSEPTD